MFIFLAAIVYVGYMVLVASCIVFWFIAKFMIQVLAFLVIGIWTIFRSSGRHRQPVSEAGPRLF